MSKLSPMRQSILTFIEEYTLDNGYPPSVREICAAVGLRSPSTVHSHIRILQEEGYLNKGEKSSRSLSLKNKPAFQSVPILGTVTAGLPILAQQEVEGYVPYLGRDNAEVFALRVRGESMINAHIIDGDIVVVRRQQTANDGDIVVALLGEEATVKRLRRRTGQIWLMPENPDFAPIDGSECMILGKVVSVCRPKV
jgi:repressor LexA